jgi:hypothetical protein
MENSKTKNCLSFPLLHTPLVSKFPQALFKFVLKHYRLSSLKPNIEQWVILIDQKSYTFQILGEEQASKLKNYFSS